MSDEVMEPLTDNIMLKRKPSKKALTDVRENVDHPPQQKPSSKTPKMKGLFGKSKQKGEQQPKKKATKPDPVTNSIRNPSNQHDMFESLPEKKATPLGTSPTYEGSNDSDFLLNKPVPTGASEKPPRAQPSADSVKRPVGKLSTLDLPVHTITHSVPISTVFPPFENHRADSCMEYSPALLGNPCSWDRTTSPVCQLETVPALSHSWEQCRESPQFDRAISNSYDSHSVLHKGQFELSTISDLKDDEKVTSDLPIPLPVPDTTQPSEEFTNFSTPLSPSTEFSSSKRKESHSVKDPSIISESEFQSFTSFFSTLNPQDGLLFGEQARTFFLRSELPNEELSRIWQLSDIDNDLKLTFGEFCIAMKLVRNRKKGFPLPQTIPPSIFTSLSQLIESQDTPLTDQYIFSAPEPMDDGTSSLEDYARTEVTSLPAEYPPLDDVTYPIEEVCPLPETDSCLLDERELEETVTVESLELPANEDIEDPIPKLSNSSVTTDYTNQIKGLFTPTPDPLPPHPTKTEMKLRSVLTPIVPTTEVTPRVEVTPAVQMRSHTIGSLTSSHTEDLSGFLEGEDNRAMLSLHGRGGTDPTDLKKKNKNRRRPDRVSAVILIDKTDNEDPQVSLINNGEVKTIELSPNSLQDRTPTFYDDLDHMQEIAAQNHNKEKTNNELTPQSSPGSNKVRENFHKKDSKMFLLKKKFMPRSKKSTGSNMSLDKADTHLEAPRKKSKVKKSNKKGKKHNRSNSLDLNTTNARMYGSQNDIHSTQDKMHAPVAAMMEQSNLFTSQRASSTLSLSPTHNQQDIHNDSDSFDSAGSSENLHSESDLSPRMRAKERHKHNRSLSSPECILSTPPIPEPSSDRLNYTYTPQTDLDDNKTPQHESAVEPYPSNERELLNQRVHETFAACESLRTVNSQLLSQLNDIRLQKEELKVQFRYYQPPRNFI